MRVEERVFRFRWGVHKIRVWAAATDLNSSQEEARQFAVLVATMDTAELKPSTLLAKVAVAEAMAAIPFVNAVEVIQEGAAGGAAILIYPDWP